MDSITVVVMLILYFIILYVKDLKKFQNKTMKIVIISQQGILNFFQINKNVIFDSLYEVLHKMLFLIFNLLKCKYYYNFKIINIIIL